MLNRRQLGSVGVSYIINSLEPCSPYGAELARRVRCYPVSEHHELEEELNNLASASMLLNERIAAFERVERAMMQLKDVRHSIERSREFTLSDVELFELKCFLIRLKALHDAYSELCNGGMGDKIALRGIEIPDFESALAILDPDGMRTLTFRIGDNASEVLRTIRAERKAVDMLLRAADTSQADGLVARRTALTAREENEEARLRAEISARLGKHADNLLDAIRSIGRLDFAMAKARLMARLNGSIPTVTAEGGRVYMDAMVNPQIAAALNEKGRRFTPVSIELEPGASVITGANMGGKSVAVKTLALNVQLALSGFPVFCRTALIPHFDEIHLLCEDMEDSLGGLSSFGGEMAQFAGILTAESEAKLSLVLLDEFARGTNPHEGAALVRAAVRYFNNSGHSIALITTHFDDVARCAEKHYQVAGLKNADVTCLAAALNENKGALERFMDYGLYQVSREENPPRDALTICRALNVPEGFMRLVED